MFRSSVIALVALLVSSSDAFVGTPSSVHHRSKVLERGVIAFDDKSTSFSPAMPASSSTTSLMAKNNAQKMLDFYSTAIFIARPDLFLYDRLARVAWDNVNKTFKQIESANAPENVLDKALADMQNDLTKIYKAYADVTESQQRLIVQKQRANTAAEALHRRARYDLSRGYEQSARDALYRRQAYLEAGKKLQAEIDAQGASRERLGDSVQALRNKYNEAIAKKEELLFRAKKAKSVKKVNDMLGGSVTTAKSDNAFAVLEKKVEEMEAAAEASSFQVSSSENNDDSRLEFEFSKLEGSSKVDQQMKNIMRELNTGASDELEQERDQLLLEDWLRTY